MIEQGEEIIGSLEYRLDLFDAETIERLLRHFENLFHSILKDPDARLDELELLSVEEQKLLRREIDVGRLSPSFSF
jgi:non-ribosomal peptide synthetase component F